MYIVLTGAKKNVGDYLITDRCKKLLRKHKPKQKLVQLPHWVPLDENLDEVNSSDAVIIMGGPGFQLNFYPDVYKLTAEIDKIKVPIIPMGVGWKGTTGDVKSLLSYKFTQNSMLALRKISRETKYISCRDYLTKFVLQNNGLSNVLMTGCPVWYDLDFINTEFRPPENIDKIVFTPPHIPAFKEQSVQLMKEIRKAFEIAKRDLKAGSNRLE